MSRETLWILNHYAQTPLTAGGTRHYELARRLIGMGYDVSIVSSEFDHVSGTARFGGLSTPRCEVVDGVRFLWLPSRFSYRDNGMARVWNMLEYSVRAYWRGRKCFGGSLGKPDVLLASSPHLLTGLAGLRLARHFDIPFLFEVRDLWPETFVQMGVMTRRHPVVLLLRRLELHLYRRSAKVVSLLPTVGEYLEPLGVESQKTAIIPNGVDAEAYACEGSRREEGPLRIVYAGAHGPANGLDNVLRAMAELAGNLEVEFHSYGDGPEKATLTALARELELANVFFHGAVPKCEIPAILCGADALLLNYARLGIGAYGISPNKLWEYLAAGKPVLFAHEATNNPVEELDCGISVPPADPAALAHAVRLLAAMTPQERLVMGARGVGYVREEHDWGVLAGKLDSLIRDVLTPDTPEAMG